MTNRPLLVVFLQAFPTHLHPVSKKILTTALALGKEKGYETVGALFIPSLKEELKEEIKNSGLSACTVFQNESFSSFFPETEAEIFCESFGEKADIVLFPATPEGRTLSAMVGAKLHTGVTADCTELSFTEDGLLLQTRPAFSGNLMASILTKTAKPQIASLRFATPIEKPERETVISIETPQLVEPSYKAEWLDKVTESSSKGEIILVVGNGVKEKEDIALFQKLADALGAELYASRLLIDKGWLPKSRQIGLSGQSVSPKFLLAFGVSGSLQFLAGLENAGTLCSVNLSPDAPLQKMADIPIVADMYAVAEALLEQLNA